MTAHSKALFGLPMEALAALMEQMQQPAYRTAQMWEGLYRQRAETLAAITTLPKGLTEELRAAGYDVGMPSIGQTFRSVDGTERYLVELADGLTVETVWMPGGDGGELGDGTLAGAEEDESAGEYKRATICLSSQVGCAVNCQFCFTAKLGLQRNLTAGEIAGQVAAVLNRQNVELGRDRINLVFMGMGEPFLNYDALMDAVRLLVNGMGVAESRMTVSTSGIVPAILKFAKEPLRPKLAISLNAPNDDVRESIMPITRKWNIEALLSAVRDVPLRPRERVTFEYVLLKGVNDQLTHATELARILGTLGMPLKVNMIVWNGGAGLDYQMPEPYAVHAFQQRLRELMVPAYIRRPRGRDIYAACGQLKRTVEAAPMVTEIGGVVVAPEPQAG